MTEHLRPGSEEEKFWKDKAKDHFAEEWYANQPSYKNLFEPDPNVNNPSQHVWNLDKIRTLTSDGRGPIVEFNPLTNRHELTIPETHSRPEYSLELIAFPSTIKEYNGNYESIYNNNDWVIVQRPDLSYFLVQQDIVAGYMLDNEIPSIYSGDSTFGKGNYEATIGAIQGALLQDWTETTTTKDIAASVPTPLQGFTEFILNAMNVVPGDYNQRRIGYEQEQEIYRTRVRTGDKTAVNMYDYGRYKYYAPAMQHINDLFYGLYEIPSSIISMGAISPYWLQNWNTMVNDYSTTDGTGIREWDATKLAVDATAQLVIPGMINLAMNRPGYFIGNIIGEIFIEKGLGSIKTTGKLSKFAKIHQAFDTGHFDSANPHIIEVASRNPGLDPETLAKIVNDPETLTKIAEANKYTLDTLEAYRTNPEVKRIWDEAIEKNRIERETNPYTPELKLPELTDEQIINQALAISNQPGLIQATTTTASSYTEKIRSFFTRDKPASPSKIDDLLPSQEFLTRPDISAQQIIDNPSLIQSELVAVVYEVPGEGFSYIVVPKKYAIDITTATYKKYGTDFIPDELNPGVYYKNQDIAQAIVAYMHDGTEISKTAQLVDNVDWIKYYAENPQIINTFDNPFTHNRLGDTGIEKPYLNVMTPVVVNKETTALRPGQSLLYRYTRGDTGIIDLENPHLNQPMSQMNRQIFEEQFSISIEYLEKIYSPEELRILMELGDIDPFYLHDLNLRGGPHSPELIERLAQNMGITDEIAELQRIAYDNPPWMIEGGHFTQQVSDTAKYEFIMEVATPSLTPEKIPYNTLLHRWFNTPAPQTKPEPNIFHRSQQTIEKYRERSELISTYNKNRERILNDPTLSEAERNFNLKNLEGAHTRTLEKYNLLHTFSPWLSDTYQNWKLGAQLTSNFGTDYLTSRFTEWFVKQREAGTRVRLGDKIVYSDLTALGKDYIKILGTRQYPIFSHNIFSSERGRYLGRYNRIESQGISTTTIPTDQQLIDLKNPFMIAARKEIKKQNKANIEKIYMDGILRPEGSRNPDDLNHLFESHTFDDKMLSIKDIREILFENNLITKKEYNTIGRHANELEGTIQTFPSAEVNTNIYKAYKDIPTLQTTLRGIPKILQYGATNAGIVLASLTFGNIFYIYLFKHIDIVIKHAPISIRMTWQNATKNGDFTGWDDLVLWFSSESNPLYGGFDDFFTSLMGTYQDPAHKGPAPLVERDPKTGKQKHSIISDLSDEEQHSLENVLLNFQMPQIGDVIDPQTGAKIEDMYVFSVRPQFRTSDYKFLPNPEQLGLEEDDLREFYAEYIKENPYSISRDGQFISPEGDIITLQQTLIFLDKRRSDSKPYEYFDYNMFFDPKPAQENIPSIQIFTPYDTNPSDRVVKPSTLMTQIGYPVGTYFEAYVKRVIDGDTIEIIHGSNPPTVIRILGMDTPETDSWRNNPYRFGEHTDVETLTTQGNFAKKFVTSILEGQTVLLYIPAQTYALDSFGRLLAYVHYADTSGNIHDLSYTLIESGMARKSPYAAPGKDSLYMAAERTAQGMDSDDPGRGVWFGYKEHLKDKTQSAYIMDQITDYSNDLAQLGLSVSWHAKGNPTSP